MFYLGLKGGLGNQMFQYAFGIAASKESNIPMVLDISNFGNEGQKYTPRDFKLHHFHIQAPVATPSEVAKFHSQKEWWRRKLIDKYEIFRKIQIDPHMFDARRLQVKDGQYVEGFLQSEKYFKKYEADIRAHLALKEPLGQEAKAALAEIESYKDRGVVTIMVHVRRGDFVTNKSSVSLLGILNPQYFLDGVEEIIKKIDTNALRPEIPKHIFVATDDVEWVKKHVKFHQNFTFISRPAIYDFEEIFIMSKCDHFVISNSTFSWWSAWLSLNPNKIVAAPKIWMQGRPDIDTSDIVPENWLRI